MDMPTPATSNRKFRNARLASAAGLALSLIVSAAPPARAQAEERTFYIDSLPNRFLGEYVPFALTLRPNDQFEYMIYAYRGATPNRLYYVAFNYDCQKGGVPSGSGSVLSLAGDGPVSGETFLFRMLDDNEKTFLVNALLCPPRYRGGAQARGFDKMVARFKEMMRLEGGVWDIDKLAR